MTFGLLGAAVLLMNAALMLSDRAPTAIRVFLGENARRVSERIDGDERARAAGEVTVLQGDAIVHITVWSLATVFVGMAIWRWRGLLIASLCVLAYAAAVELAQGRFSTSRSVEGSDFVFNIVGVAGGMIAVAAVFHVYDSITSRPLNRG